MDLVGRKMMDGGEAALRLIEEIEQNAHSVRAQYPNIATAVWDAAETLRETTEWLVEQEANDRYAGAVAYQRAFARILGSHFHLRSAMAEGRDGPRTALARVAIKRLLPEHVALLAQVRQGAAGLYALSDADLAA
jgi:acyl-CoA dehydrogenase